MDQYVHAAVQVVSGLSGLALLVIAFFLYEDEEGNLRSTLEDAWVRIRDLSSSAIRPHIAFALVAAERAQASLRRVYGPSLVSVQVVYVATCLSIASLFLGIAILDTLAPLEFIGITLNVTNVVKIYALYVLAIVAFRSATVHLRETVSEELWLRRLWMMAGSVVLFIALYVNLLARGDWWHASVLEPGIVPGLAKFWRESRGLLLATPLFLVLSITLDVLGLLLTMWLLRFIARGRSLVGIIGAVLVGVVGIVAGLMVPVFLAVSSRGEFANIGGWLLVSNVPDVLSYLTFLMLCTSLILHRLLWASVERPIYAVARFGLLEHRVTIACVGLAFLGYAIPEKQEVIGWLYWLIGR